jgi:DNA repair ATPase RecN
MNHLKQVTWIQAAEKRIADLEALNRLHMVDIDTHIGALKEIWQRLEALEAKRGPGRPKVERDTSGNDRKV